MITDPDVVPDDTLPRFRAALPADLRNRLHITAAVVAYVHAAVREHGWTIPQLAAECSRDLDGVGNAGAVITHRLEHASKNPAPLVRSRVGLPVRPLCGACEHGWLYDDTNGTATRCPCRTTTPPEATA